MSEEKQFILGVAALEFGISGVIYYRGRRLPLKKLVRTPRGLFMLVFAASGLYTIYTSDLIVLETQKNVSRLHEDRAAGFQKGAPSTRMEDITGTAEAFV